MEPANRLALAYYLQAGLAFSLALDFEDNARSCRDRCHNLGDRSRAHVISAIDNAAIAHLTREGNLDLGLLSDANRDPTCAIACRA